MYLALDVYCVVVYNVCRIERCFLRVKYSLKYSLMVIKRRIGRVIFVDVQLVEEATPCSGYLRYTFS